MRYAAVIWTVDLERRSDEEEYTSVVRLNEQKHSQWRIYYLEWLGGRQKVVLWAD